MSGGRSSTPPLRESLSGNPPPPQARRAAEAATLTLVPSPPVLSLIPSEIGPSLASLHLPGLALVAHTPAGPTGGLPVVPRGPGHTGAVGPLPGRFSAGSDGERHLGQSCPVPRSLSRQPRPAGHTAADVGENLLCSGPKQT